MATATCTKTNWSTIRTQVERINPKLTQLIDELSPDDALSIYKVTLPFGTKLLEEGSLQLPDQTGQLKPLQEHATDIQKDLGYIQNANPAGLVLSKQFELFLEVEDRALPFSMLKPGDLFGFWKIFDHSFSHCPTTFLWSLSAGARSTFMLPKISDDRSHKRLLLEHNAQANKPNTYQEHWKTFKALSHAQPWKAELVFFSQAWIEKLHDPSWATLKSYILDELWKSTSFWRNQFIWGLVFKFIDREKKFKHTYYSDIARHILAISTGDLLGFRPAVDEMALPLEFIQSIYLEHYQLKYIPTIMVPERFKLQTPASPPIYYSLNYPTVIELSSKPVSYSTTIADISALQDLLLRYKNKVLDYDLNLQDTPLYYALSHLEYDFYHSTKNHYPGIDAPEQFLAEDKAFNHSNHAKQHNVTEVATAASFMKGCVRIRHPRSDELS